MDPVLGSGQKKGAFWSKVFCTFKSLRNDDGGEYLKDLPDFGYEVQVEGLPEGHQDDGEKDSAVASTARMTTPRPMGAKAAKRAQVQAQNSQKKSKAMAKAVKGMGSKVEDVAKAMREKSVLDRYHCMLELYPRAGNQEKVEKTIAKMDTFMGDKFLVDSESEKAADTTDDSGDGSINDDGTVSEVE